jgi:uncharacterized membrane protein SpoIIM required for sporulation
VAPTLRAFVENGTARWEELEGLVAASKGRIDRLDRHGVRRLGAGYRQATADLALARRRFPQDPVTVRLDAVVRAARPLVYAQVTERESVVDFVTTGYWRRVREKPRFLLVATIALYLPALVLGLWAHGNPAEARRVAQVSPLSAGLGQDGPRDPDTEKVTEADANAAFSTQIFTNNARVALVAFAGALTGGVLTVISLVFNGLILGLVAGIGVESGYGETLIRLIAPHGFLELSLITASGAAGLRTGWALLRPGHRTRAEALTAEGRPGVEMALGSAVLLVPCGLVEGFVTPRGLGVPAALTVGLGLGILYWALVIWRGRPAAGGGASGPTGARPT